MEEGELKVAHVQRVKAKGRIYLYFRKDGYREGPLKAEWGTKALQDEVDAILHRLDRAAVATAKPRPGNLRGAFDVYTKSGEFLVLARSTQAEYQRMIDELKEDCGDVLLGEIDRSWVIEMRDAWALRGHKVANNHMQMLRNALGPIVADEKDLRITVDPFAKVKNVPRPRDAGEVNPAWEDYEVEAGIAEALRRGTPGLARAIALGRWGGFRRGTICKIPLSARVRGFDEEGEEHQRLNWITEKRKVLCDKTEDPRLTALIAGTPNRALTLAYNADGHPWKERQLNQAIDRLMNHLAKKGVVRASTDDEGDVWYAGTIHGLRHARGVELAQSGATDAQIMAQLEHTTAQQAQEYRRQADRRKLADEAQKKIDNVIKLRAAKKAAQAGGNRP